MKFLPALCLLCCLTFVGCSSVPKLLYQGEYEAAYAKARKHCTRARAPKIKHLQYFQEAYAAVQARDFDRTITWKAASGTAKWEPLYELYAGLYERSLDLLAISPEARDFQFHPELLPATLEQQREEARRNAGDHYLALAAPLLPVARAGDKPAARKAFSHYEKVAYFLPERRAEFQPLRDQLYDLAMLRILLYAPPGDFSRELTSATRRLKPFTRNWTTILPFATEAPIDLEAELVVTEVEDIAPTETCAVSTYEEEVLDRIERKKVVEQVNDSTTVEKIVEIKHYRTVYATVTTCEQQAAVNVSAQLSVFSPGVDTPEWSQGLSNCETWSNTYSFGSGDARALPAFANSGSPAYPEMEDLFLEALSDLPRSARRALVKKYAPRKNSVAR